MKKIKAITSNLENETLGIITTRHKGVISRGKYIYVKSTTAPQRGYQATISDLKLSKKTNEHFCQVENISQLKDGDVVLINSEMDIVVLYERESRHNAIMATERCNHRCIMCPQPPVTEEQDRTDFNLHLISLFDKNTKEIGITGGEPTLIGDKLFDLIRHIQTKLPKTAISLLSNGVKFANKEYTFKLAACQHRDLQIDIPIFSDIASEHNKIVGANTFYKTVEGLYNLALYRQRIGVRIVIHKLNYKRLPQLAEYLYRNFPFISQIAFMQMETHGLAETNINELWIDPYDYNEYLEKAVLLLEDRGVNTYIYNAQLCVLPNSIREYAQQSISDWKNIYIEECAECALKSKCAGFFESNRNKHSNHIKKVFDCNKTE